MKRHWLRGVVLGVSLSLLLAGGVALAQGLWLTVDKECVPCYAGPPGDGAPPQQYRLTISFGGWNPQYDLCASVAVNGVIFDEGCDPPPNDDPYEILAAFPCEGFTAQQGPGMSWSGPDAGVSQPPEVLGQWRYRVWQEETGQSAAVTWRVAEVCEAEFVPEPGTLMLLGSGLAGLAGYATLRWRTRE